MNALTKYFDYCNKTILLYLLITFPLVCYCIVIILSTFRYGNWYYSMYSEVMLTVSYLFLILNVNLLSKKKSLSSAIQIILMWIVVYSLFQIISLRRSNLVAKFNYLDEYDFFNLLFYHTIVLLLTLIVSFQFLPISLKVKIEKKLKFVSTIFAQKLKIQDTFKIFSYFSILLKMFIATTFLYVVVWGIIKIMDPAVNVLNESNISLVKDLNGKVAIVKTITTQTNESPHKFVFRIGNNEFQGAQNLEIQFSMESVIKQLVKTKNSGLEIQIINNFLQMPTATVELSKNQSNHTFDWNRGVLVNLLREGEVLVKNYDSKKIISKIFLDYYDYECNPIAGFRADETYYFAIDHMPEENRRPPCFN
jgi:hypothetical protein